jgi:hypothetical protein
MAAKSMKERAAALMAKANDPAASEAEANLCMQKAMDLMAKFGFTMSEIEGDQAEQIGRSKTAWTNGRPGGAMFYVQNEIAAFTNTRVSFTGTVSQGTSMTYHGYGAERDLAVWLHGHILNAIKVASAAYDPGPFSPAIRARDRKSFAIYMAKRIAERLVEMTETLDDNGRGTGTDVLIVKNKKVDDYYDALGLPGAAQRKHTLYRAGATAGAEAGENVTLHRPLDDDAGPLRIAAPQGQAQ